MKDSNSDQSYPTLGGNLAFKSTEIVNQGTSSLNQQQHPSTGQFAQPANPTPLGNYSVGTAPVQQQPSNPQVQVSHHEIGSPPYAPTPQLQNYNTQEELASFNKGHNVFAKDVFRVNKADNFNEKAFKHLKVSKEFGRTDERSYLNLTRCKYTAPQRVILEQFEKAALPENRLYAIDKVVRQRGIEGRFGVDHSEVLNFELEVTNKPRDDHMNWLVYKGRYQDHSSSGMNTLDNTHVSQMLLSRLNLTEDEKNLDDPVTAARLKRQQSPTKTQTSQKSLMKPQTRGSRANLSRQSTAGPGSQSGKNKSSMISQSTFISGLNMSYAEWCKQKDAERRLKKKLICQAQDQVRSQLLHMAQGEQENFQSRVAAMDDWLMNKKQRQHGMYRAGVNAESQDEQDEQENSQVQNEASMRSFKQFKRLKNKSSSLQNTGSGKNGTSHKKMRRQNEESPGQMSDSQLEANEMDIDVMDDEDVRGQQQQMMVNGQMVEMDPTQMEEALKQIQRQPDHHMMKQQQRRM